MKLFFLGWKMFVHNIMSSNPSFIHVKHNCINYNNNIIFSYKRVWVHTVRHV